MKFYSRKWISLRQCKYVLKYMRHINLWKNVGVISFLSFEQRAQFKINILETCPCNHINIRLCILFFSYLVDAANKAHITMIYTPPIVPWHAHASHILDLEFPKTCFPFDVYSMDHWYFVGWDGIYKCHLLIISLRGALLLYFITNPSIHFCNRTILIKMVIYSRPFMHQYDFIM